MAEDAKWLKEVRRWLHLGRKGVIVMIRDAQLSQLKRLFVLMTELDEQVEVTQNAEDLLSYESGSLVLLLVREQELDWLNLNRPLFSQRSLRVVLWVEAPLSEQLKFKSPDLHDWVSHFVACQPGVPAFAVEGLRVGSSWWPGVAWRGLGLAVALRETSLSLTPLDPGSPFEELVTTLREDVTRPICWSGVDSLGALWRVRWAIAEARHRGFCVLDNPSVRTPGWFPVTSAQEFESDQALREQIEEEFEPEITTSELDVVLLKHAGKSLRVEHDSSRIAARRREIVREIRKSPKKVWSRDEVALFASLERDRRKWPFLVGAPRHRHLAEHRLRQSQGRRQEDLLAVQASHLSDVELVERWSPSRSLAEKLLRHAVIGASPKELLGGELPPMIEFVEFAEAMGWDLPSVVHMFAKTAEQQLDAPELEHLLSDVMARSIADLGEHDERLIPLYEISFIAATLADQDTPVPRYPRPIADMFTSRQDCQPTLAAVLILRNSYTPAAALLAPLADDEQIREMYIAALVAMGQSAAASVEHQRLTGRSEGLSERDSPNEFARAYLLERLRSF